MKKVYKPTKEELENYENRSDYCIRARDERIKLVRSLQILNRYSNCEFTLPEDFKERKENYLNEFVYFEKNSLEAIIEKEKNGEKVAWGNKLFSIETINKKISEFESI